jgi:hypothetical protein
MRKNLFSIEHFFKDKKALDIADFIVVRIEAKEQYIVYKCCKFDFYRGDVISQIF